MIYLDNNATTRLTPGVAAELSAAFGERYANPASAHAEGRRARRALEQARRTIGLAVGASLERFDSDRVVLTSGATEANHLAILGLAPQRPGRLVVSAVEHPSLLAPAERIAQQGRPVTRLRVDAQGRAELGHLEELLSGDPVTLVSLQLVNHETGVLQPVEEASRLCASHGVPLHVDATQGVGKLSVDMGRLGVAAITYSAHKLHGPVGIGALVLRHGTLPVPLWGGGGQQQGLRPGTENVPLAMGFAAALREAGGADATFISRRRDEFERQLVERFGAVVHGAGAPRAPHTSCASFPGRDRQELLLALDARGLACSAGAACASGASEPSPVLTAMGVEERLVEGALRFSQGLDTSDDDIARAVEILSLVLG